MIIGKRLVFAMEKFRTLSILRLRNYSELKEPDQMFRNARTSTGNVLRLVFSRLIMILRVLSSANNSLVVYIRPCL